MKSWHQIGQGFKISSIRLRDHDVTQAISGALQGAARSGGNRKKGGAE
jgi:hypothetical protein